MKRKSHRVLEVCEKSGVETPSHTTPRRLDGHSLYSAEHAAGPREFQTDHRPLRSAARQLRRRRRAAEGDRRSTRPDLALGQRHPRPAPAGQGGALAPGSAAAARLRAGLWVRRLQRRRAAGRRPHPQVAARARSARGRGLGVAANAVAVRERGTPGRPLSARDGVGRYRVDVPPRPPGRRGPVHHDRPRCHRRPDPWAAGARPLQRLLRHLVLSAPHRHSGLQHRADAVRGGRGLAAGHGDRHARRARPAASVVCQAPGALSSGPAARAGRCWLRRGQAAHLPGPGRGRVRAGAAGQSTPGQASATPPRPSSHAGAGHRGIRPRCTARRATRPDAGTASGASS
jgi:hypothetical protein